MKILKKCAVQLMEQDVLDTKAGNNCLKLLQMSN